MLHRLQHLLRRLYLDDDDGPPGFEQALEAGHNERPALAAAGQDGVGNLPLMRFGHREAHGAVERVDLKGDETLSLPAPLRSGRSAWRRSRSGSTTAACAAAAAR